MAFAPVFRMRPASMAALGPRERVLEALRSHLSSINAMAVVRVAEQRAGIDSGKMQDSDLHRLIGFVKSGLPMFLGDEAALTRCVASLDDLSGAKAFGGARGLNTVVRLEVNTEDDVVAARMAGRQVAEDIGFRSSEQVKIATAISELARNIVSYAKRGSIEIRALDGIEPGIEIIARDNGPGIANVDAILAGRYKSRLGMGLGLRGTKNLMDEMDIETALGVGTTVRIRKRRR